MTGRVAVQFGRRWHVLRADGEQTGCGLPADLAHPRPLPARLIDADRRCRAGGCRLMWPALLQLVREAS